MLQFCYFIIINAYLVCGLKWVEHKQEKQFRVPGNLKKKMIISARANEMSFIMNLNTYNKLYKI